MKTIKKAFWIFFCFSFLAFPVVGFTHEVTVSPPSPLNSIPFGSSVYFTCESDLDLYSVDFGTKYQCTGSPQLITGTAGYHDVSEWDFSVPETESQGRSSYTVLSAPAPAPAPAPAEINSLFTSPAPLPEIGTVSVDTFNSAFPYLMTAFGIFIAFLIIQKIIKLLYLKREKPPYKKR